MKQFSYLFPLPFQAFEFIRFFKNFCSPTKDKSGNDLPKVPNYFPAERIRLLEFYRALPIRMDMMLNSDIMGRFQTLGLEYHLSAYDAAYLELVQRTGLGPATGDRPLRLAAQRAGIKLISKA